MCFFPPNIKGEMKLCRMSHVIVGGYHTIYIYEIHVYFISECIVHVWKESLKYVYPIVFLFMSMSDLEECRRL